MKLVRVFLVFFIFNSFYSFSQQVESGPSLQDQFIKKVGNLRFSKTTIAWGKIKNNEVLTDTIYIYNAGKNEITIAAPAKTPVFLSVSVNVGSLKPGEKGWMIVNYDAAKRNDFGVVFDRFFLTTSDDDQAAKNINLTATIQEFFPPALEGDTLITKVVFPETIFDFGRIKQGDKVSKIFTVSNSGTKKLFIRAVKNTCGCIKSIANRMEINPGESASIKVDYDSFAKEGKENKTVFVYFSDPTFSEVKIEVKGEVFK